MCVCILFVSSTSHIGTNPSASAIAVNKQSAKDIDQYFKTELHVVDSLPSKVETHFTEWSEVNPKSERMAVSTVGGICSHNLYIPIRRFWARPEKKTQSYILKLTTYIITYIIKYIFIVVGCIVYSM